MNEGKIAEGLVVLHSRRSVEDVIGRLRQMMVTRKRR